MSFSVFTDKRAKETERQRDLFFGGDQKNRFGPTMPPHNADTDIGPISWHLCVCVCVEYICSALMFLFR